MKKSVIDHTYRDYSQTDITDFPDDDRQQTSEELFPAKLHRILNTPEYEEIIAWMPHGRVWKVKNKSVFVSYILPRHFQHSNYESFNRSVNGWGMKRLYQDGPDQKGYYHELFLRGKIDLCGGMHRLKSPGKRLPNKAGEPDFYEISRRYPLDPPPPVTVHNSYINVQGDTRPSPRGPRQKSTNNIVPLPQQQYPYGGYNPYMMMNQQQQYQMMPTSPPHLQPQQYHEANLRAYYAQLPYSNPSSVPPTNAAPTPPVRQHPNGGAPVQRLTSAPVPAQAETDEEVYGEEEIDPNDPPVEFDEKLYQRVVAIEKALPVLHTNQHNKKKGEEEPKATMMEKQPPYEDQAAQAATDPVLAAFQAHAAQLGGSTSTHV